MLHRESAQGASHIFQRVVYLEMSNCCSLSHGEEGGDEEGQGGIAEMMVAEQKQQQPYSKHSALLSTGVILHHCQMRDEFLIFGF